MAPREPAASPYPQYPASITPNTGTTSAQTGGFPAQTGSFPTQAGVATGIYRSGNEAHQAGVVQTGTVPAQTGSFPIQAGVTPTGSVPALAASARPAPAASQTGAIPGLPQLSTEIAPVVDPIITVRGLRKTYDSPGGDPIIALDNISIDFPRGQFTAIMGPSGSGKSSLLHCIVGLDSFQEGIVKVAGKNLATMSSAELTEFRRVTVGFIFQSYNLIPTLSARENIEIAAELQRHQVDRKHFKDLVNRLDLGKRLNAFPSQLSGGQQQKVACARALLTRPAVVVADEPTGSLDSESAAEVLAFLRGAAADWGQSVVMVTHEPDAAQYASSVLFLRDGRLVAQLTNPTREAILEAQQALGQLRSGGSAVSVGLAGSVALGGSVALDAGSLGAISGGVAESRTVSGQGVVADDPAGAMASAALGGSVAGGNSAGAKTEETQDSPWFPVKSGGSAAATTAETDDVTLGMRVGFGLGSELGAGTSSHEISTASPAADSGVNPFNPVNNPLADAAVGLAAAGGNAGGSLVDSPVGLGGGAESAGNSLAPHETETPATKPPEKPKNRRSSWRNRKKRRPVADPALAQTFANLGVAVPDSEPNELADSLANGQFKWPSLSEASPDMDEGDNELLGQPLGLFARRPVPAPPTVPGETASPTGTDTPSGSRRPPVPAAPPTPPVPVALGQSPEPAELAGFGNSPELAEPSGFGNPPEPAASPAPTTSAPNPAVPMVTSAFTLTPGGGAAAEPDLTTPNVTLTDATQTGVGFLRRVAGSGYGFVPDDSAVPSGSGAVAGSAGLDAASLGAIPDSGSMGIAAGQNPDTGAIPGQTEFGSEVPGWAQQLAPAAAEPGFEPGSSLAASGWALSDTGQTRPIPSQPVAGEAAKSGGVAAGQTGYEPDRVEAGVALGQADTGVFAAPAGVGGVVGTGNSGIAAAQVGQMGYGAAASGNTSSIVPGQTGDVAGSVNSLAPRETEITPAINETATAPTIPSGIFGGGVAGSGTPWADGASSVSGAGGAEAAVAGEIPGEAPGAPTAALSVPGLTEGQAAAPISTPIPASIATPIPEPIPEPTALGGSESEPENVADNARAEAGTGAVTGAATDAVTGAVTGAREDESSGELSRPRRRRRASVDPQEAELAGQNELLQMIAQAEKLLAASGAAISDAQDALTSPEKSGKSKETGVRGSAGADGSGGASSVSGAGGNFNATIGASGLSSGGIGVAAGRAGDNPAGAGVRGSAGAGGSLRGSVRQSTSTALGASPVSSVPSAATTNIYRSATSTFTSVKGNASLAELAHSLGLEDVITAGRDQSGGASNPGTRNLDGSRRLSTPGGSTTQWDVRGGTGATSDKSGLFSPHSSPDSPAARGVSGATFGSGSLTSPGAGSADSAAFGSGASAASAASGVAGTTSSGFRSFMAGASGQTSAGDSGSTRGTTPDQDLLIARADAMLAQANAQSLDLQRSLLDLENPAGSPSQYRDAARMAPHESATPNHNPTPAPTTDPKGR